MKVGELGANGWMMPQYDNVPIRPNEKHFGRSEYPRHREDNLIVRADTPSSSSGSNDSSDIDVDDGANE